MSRTRALFLLACLPLSACGPGALDGSLNAVLDLSYDAAEVRWTADEVAVAFVRTTGEVTLRVTASLDLVDTVAQVPINLAEQLTPTRQRGTLSRSVLNDTTTRFPPLERGTLRLDGTPVKGQHLTGTFNATFIDGTAEPFGRTVSGTFDALVQQTP